MGGRAAPLNSHDDTLRCPHQGTLSYGKFPASGNENTNTNGNPQPLLFHDLIFLGFCLKPSLFIRVFRVQRYAKIACISQVNPASSPENVAETGSFFERRRLLIFFFPRPFQTPISGGQVPTSRKNPQKSGEFLGNNNKYRI